MLADMRGRMKLQPNQNSSNEVVNNYLLTLPGIESQLFRASTKYVTIKLPWWAKEIVKCYTKDIEKKNKQKQKI